MYESYFRPNKNVIVVPAGSILSRLYGDGFYKGAPTNIIVTSHDMKIHYIASGYTSSKASALKSKLKQLMP